MSYFIEDLDINVTIDGGDLPPMASQVQIVDSGALYTSGNVEGALQEVGTDVLALENERLMLTNLVTNGDFSNGTTGWAPSSTTLSAVSNTLSITGDGTSAYPQVTKIETTPVAPGHLMYYKAKARVTNSVCLIMALQIDGSTAGTNTTVASQSSPVINQWYDLSGIAAQNANFTGFFKSIIYNQYADSITANGKVMEVQQVSCINLTQIFGAGKEPTKAQMDIILASTGWFNGTLAYNQKAMYKELIAKADKVQEAWITPTLLNGATTSGTNPIRYRKNQFGVVEFEGSITVVSGQVITLPVGYIIASGRSIRHPLLNTANTTLGAFVILSQNQVYITVGSWSLDGVKFIAEA